MSDQRYQGASAPLPGGHTPVMLREVMAVLAPRDGGIYLDGTFGGGSYSFALLEAANCRVWAIDRDPSAIAAGEAASARYDGRLSLLAGCFGDMDRLMSESGDDVLDGIALDLGVSSMQIDDPARGFSFQADGPLDMRMSAEASSEEAAGGELSATQAVNSLSEAELTDIIRRFGEERRARQVARAIVTARKAGPIERTAQLAEIVRRVVRRSPDGIDPATRTFQALRIYVNDELGELNRGLRAAERLLAPGGRLAVVSFHSLEDRAVKGFLMERSGRTAGGSRHGPESLRKEAVGPAPTFELMHRGAQRPGQAECARNPRARSARLRAARRTDAPAWDQGVRGDHDVRGDEQGRQAVAGDDA